MKGPKVTDILFTIWALLSAIPLPYCLIKGLPITVGGATLWNIWLLSSWFLYGSIASGLTITLGVLIGALPSIIFTQITGQRGGWFVDQHGFDTGVDIVGHFFKSIFYFWLPIGLLSLLF